MNSYLILFIVLTIVFPGITFIVTNSWIPALIVLLITGIYFFLFAYQVIKKIYIRNRRFHSCYTFINTFLISISIKGSLVAAFESTRVVMDKEYIELVDGISNLNEEDKLDYLKKHYQFDLYYLFLSVIKIWIEQGGDIFTIAYYLIEESKRDEDYLIKCESITKRKIIDFSLLWGFTLIIVLILRFALNSIYHQITSFLLFQVAIVVLFMLILLSVHLYITKINKVEVKGYRNA